jgi:phosphatidylserine/phosphatidylglycerophosphate/cardiolipin synthase-like enzyme
MKSKIQRPLTTFLFLILFTLVAACTSGSGQNQPFDGTPDAVKVFPTPTGEAATNWYEIYFTDPDCPPEEERYGGLDALIAADLLQAQQQVDIAAYDLDANPLIDALIELKKRGVTVRVVTDDNNGKLPAIRRLRRNGVNVIEDNRSGLMHNKFIVIDGYIVYTGSINFTSNGFYCNNNNLVRINSSRLAENYLAEMDEMFDDHLFGPTSPDNTPNEQLAVNSIEIENYFTSEFKAAEIIAERIAYAEEEILFMAYVLTEQQIGDTMMAQAADGISVRGVYDFTSSSSEYSYYAPMRVSPLPNLEVWQDGNSAAMHHKIIIIDQETVILGSFNFSESANSSNDENILIVHDPVFASYFVEEFETVIDEAKARWQGEQINE